MEINVSPPSPPASPPSLLLLSTTWVLDSRESTRRRSGCFLLPAKGTWAEAMPCEKCTFTLSPQGAGTCQQARACEQDPGVRDGRRCRQLRLGCPRAKRGAHPWCHPSTKRRHGPCWGVGGWLCPGWAATCWAGTARRVGMPSAWGSRRPDVGAWQGPHGPEASLCARPTSGTWHSGHAGGSEAETKQPSPWQCPRVRDKCPRLSREDGHKELLAGTGSLPGPAPARVRPRATAMQEAPEEEGVPPT